MYRLMLALLFVAATTSTRAQAGGTAAAAGTIDPGMPRAPVKAVG